MIDLISELFERNGFSREVEFNNGAVFSVKTKDLISDYWLVIEFEDLRQVLEKQHEFFETCKKSIPDRSLDKNLSMLVLWNTGGDIEIREMKSSVMSVEEDTYFFKKNVLYYSDVELENLKETLKDRPIYDFLKKQLTNKEVFLEYKLKPLSQAWQALIYRISIKIPFIDIDIGLSGGLDSLYKTNTKEILRRNDKEVIRLEKEFFGLNSENDSIEDYLDKLVHILRD